MLLLLIADTPAMCYNDQVLGTWNISISKYDYYPKNDKVVCSPNFQVDEYKEITLIAPNVAIDKKGITGTWTMIYTQAVEINIGNNKYYFQLDYKRASSESDPVQWIDSYCNQSDPNAAWAVEQGVTRGVYACFTAVNINPTTHPVHNHHIEGELGPVNSHPLRTHKLNGKFPIGKTYHKLKNLKALQKQKLASPYKGTTLPEQFDWRNVNGSSYVPEPFDQRSCGSCYACASIYMYMSRIRVSSKNQQKPNLSIQHAVDCNFYSQGCAGGFDQQVSKFAEEFGIKHESDYKPYSAEDEKCEAGEFLSGNREFFQAYQPLGGYYGAVYDPTEMQWELHRNGPFVVSVMVEGNFPDDPYGDQEPSKYAEEEDGERHYYISEANHAVLLIGWTTLHDGNPAWIIQNSWGKSWNGDGTFLLARGSNAYGVESYPGIAFWRPDGAVHYPEVVTETALTFVTVVLGALLSVVTAVMLVLAIMLCKKNNASGYKKIEDAE
ncbi:Dipeptidyl-peptidase I [Spironucleus salmonicida]|uniref:Dipeptidyl peptidase 1 n=1 Tax=Spironucleus salmonicida TaxID=348837 RepID=V6LWF9_9EUKA|nr:Dipeptidyl-peptidase I [Spironucleus salmonicida]|eukprot:EST48967.1 Dipeptidyl-peptidase I precursor [Spironucleus salmonicida]